MPERIQRKRVKGWRMPPNTLYCGRGSKYGNMHKVEREGHIFKVFDPKYFEGNYRYFLEKKYAHACAVRLYQEDMDEYLKINPQYFDDLKGYEYLACFCALGLPCHVDVLIRWLTKDAPYKGYAPAKSELSTLKAEPAKEILSTSTPCG